MWEELIVRGAPKALGDMFLACIGAMVLDGPGYTEKHTRVLEKHMQLCASFKPRRPDRVQYRTPEDVEVYELLQFLNRAGTTIRRVSLAPLAPGQAGATDDQLLRALAFTDICVCTVDGEATGGVTPRRTCLRRAKQAAWTPRWTTLIRRVLTTHSARRAISG